MLKPTMNRVVLVYSNGATENIVVPWFALDYRKVVWRFIDNDRFNDPVVTGKSSGLKAVGQRAKFEKKYGMK